jgi:hypothetical protein
MQAAASSISWAGLYTVVTLAVPGSIWAGIVATVAFKRFGLMLRCAEGLLMSGALATGIGCVGAGLLSHKGVAFGLPVGLPLVAVGLSLLIVAKSRNGRAINPRS